MTVDAEFRRVAAYHRMQAKAWGELLRKPDIPCQSPELTRLETYRPYGT